MRIVVNDIAASTGGALTVLKEFYNCVAEYGREHEWIFLLGDHLLEETDHIRVKVLKEVKASGFKKLLFDFVTGRKLIHSLQPDVVISLQNIITFGVNVPQLVYIHQAIPFQNIKNYSFFKKGEQKLAVIQHLIGAIIKRSAKRSDLVIVQTRWMQKAVCHSCRLPADKVLVATPNVQGAACADGADFCREQFFYPTMLQSYKNNAAIMEASRLLKQKGLAHTVTLTLPEEHSREHINCVGRLPYEQVQAHYASSTLLFPSYMETFGYPLAEARKAGTVILAADTPFAREVLEGYENGYFFDPFRPEELAALMEQVLSGQICRKSVPHTQTQDTDGWRQVLELIVRHGRQL